MRDAMETLNTPPLTTPPSALSLDELVASGLSRSELDVVAAYQWATGLSVLTIVAKMRVAA